MRKNDRFGRGGCYTCKACGRKTRETGDGAGVGMCDPCFDLASYQNQISDYGNDAEMLADALEECRRAAKTILAKGGVMDDDPFWAEHSRMDEIHELAIALGR